MALQLKPLYDNVLVKRVDSSMQYKGSLVIPDIAKEKSQEGLVIAVGEGRLNDQGEMIPLIVSENSRILFAKYSGSEIRFNGEEYLMMKETDIQALILIAGEGE